MTTSLWTFQLAISSFILTLHPYPIKTDDKHVEPVESSNSSYRSCPDGLRHTVDPQNESACIYLKSIWVLPMNPGYINNIGPEDCQLGSKNLLKKRYSSKYLYCWSVRRKPGYNARILRYFWLRARLSLILGLTVANCSKLNPFCPRVLWCWTWPDCLCNSIPSYVEASLLQYLCTLTLYCLLVQVYGNISNALSNFF